MADKRAGDGTAIGWTPDDLKRFVSYSLPSERPTDDSCCWEWRGGRTPDGYGKFWLAGRTIGAHVFAFAVAFGWHPAIVRHRCDNPPCVRPSHLQGGSQHDNLLDAVERGRVPHAERTLAVSAPLKRTHGERNGSAVLTTAQVSTIRSRYAAGRQSVRSLADEFGVGKSMIHNIVTGKSWRHV